jgi:hypothetical protein
MIERLHLIVKEGLSVVHNPRDFEASMMRVICNRQLQNIRGINLGLVGEASLPGFDGVQIAHGVRLRGLDIYKGDLVQRNGIVAKVCACSREGCDYLLIVDLMRFQRDVCPHAEAWKFIGAQTVWPAIEAEHLRAWHADGDCVIVLR